MMKNKTNILKHFFMLALTTSINIANVAEASDTTSNRTDSVGQYAPITFQDYLSKVGKNNLSYIAEKYNIDIAEAEVISQKVLPDPEISIEGTDNGQFYQNKEMGYVVNVGLAYTLELGNKRGARVALAKSQAQLERLNVEVFFQDLRAEAAKAYIEAMKEKDVYDVKRRSHEYMNQLSVSDSLRFRLGEISENEARQSKIEASSLLNEMYQQEAAYKSALALLNQFMGIMATDLNLPSENWLVFDKKYDLPSLIKIALENRIDIRVASQNTDVSTKELKLTRAERKIDLGLSLGFERNSKVKNPEAEADAYNAIIAGVSVPLKFSNRNKGAIKAAKYAIEKSKVEAMNTNLEVQTEVSQAFFNYEASQKQLKQFTNGLLDDSKKLVEGEIYRYKRGESSILEVLMAQRTYNEKHEEYYEALKNNASALVELQKACGIWDIEL